MQVDEFLTTEDYVKVICDLTALVAKYEATLNALHRKHQELDAEYDKALKDLEAIKKQSREG